MFSKVIIALFAASSVLAAPGGGSGSWSGEEECSTTCGANYITQSTVYQETTEIASTTTNYVPITEYQTKTWEVTKTLTSTGTKEIVTSTPYTTVIWQPVTTKSEYEVPYTTSYEEATTIPYVTTSAKESVVTAESTYPVTSQWVETSSWCSTSTISGGWGASSSSAASGW